ncbi:MAG: MFS transporter [Pseudomonadota bacterium]
MAGQRPRPGALNLRTDRALAVFVVGVIGVLIPGLQPQLLGALAAEGHLSVAALGLLATAELLAMGLAAGGAGFILPATRLVAIAAIALLTTGAIDLVTPFLGSGALFGARIVAGLAEGVLIWIAIGLIVRTSHPERWSGIYLAVQTLAQFALASAIGYSAAGSRGAFTALGVVTLAGLLALPWLPHSYAPLATDGEPGGLPHARGLVALGGVVAYLAFIVAVWVYIEPLALEHGVPAATIHLIAPLSLAMQVLGAGAAALLAERVPARLAIAAVGLLNLGLLATMAAPPSPAAFLVATAAFGFLWLFILPFQISIAIAADPSRRAALLIGGAQLTGSSLGPFLAGLLIGDKDVARVLWFGAFCAAAGMMALIGAGTARRLSRKV